MTRTQMTRYCPNSQGGGTRCVVALRESAAVWAVTEYLYGLPSDGAPLALLPEHSMAYCDEHGDFPWPIDLRSVVPQVDELMRSRFATALYGRERAYQLGQDDTARVFEEHVAGWVSAHWLLRRLARANGLSALLCLEWGDLL